MKTLFLLFFCGFAPYLYAQNSLGSLNANAVSTTAYSHTIGDIYIAPAANVPSNSGMMGVLSGIRAQLVAVENTAADAPQTYFYPNPVENILNLGIKNQDNTTLQASIFDLTGRLMLSQTIQNGQIDLSALATGAYLVQIQHSLVQIQHSDEQISFKIVKK